MNIPSWFKPRNYLHLDSPISLKQAIDLVSSPNKVAKHSFYPFLCYTLSIHKLTKKDGKLARTTKDRGISYASHKDSHIFSYYSHILSERYESFLSNSEYDFLNDSILAFRQLNRSNIDFAKLAFNHINNFRDCSVLALDISSFFDHLDHKYLKEMWKKLLKADELPDDHYAVFNAITKFTKIDREDIFNYFNISKNNPRGNNRNRICSPKEFRDYRKSKKFMLFRDHSFKVNKDKKGIPQGSPISALLSNIYMLEFDYIVKKKVVASNGIYLRYCDDILCILPNGNVDEIHDFIINEIKTNLKLEINDKKTEVINFRFCNKKNKVVNDKRLQYLGFIYHNGTISIRSQAFNKYSNKMKRGVSLAKQTQRKYNAIRESKGLPYKSLYRRKLYCQYSHFGKTTFISYGKRASLNMDSLKIRKQLKPLWFRLKKEII